MGTSFDHWADVYDSVYSYVRDDIPYYVKEALESKGPVLELGSGTGRVTIPIANSGIDIVGLDSSSAMLEVAKLKSEKFNFCDSRISFVKADMRNFSLLPTGKFPLIIIPFRGFLSLLTVQDQISTLQNVKHHLSDNGKIIISIFVPDLDMLVQEDDLLYHIRDVTDSESGKKMVLSHRSNYDNYNQIITTRMIIEELDDDDEMTKRFYRDFQLRYIYRWEMEHLFSRTGFKSIALYGDFEKSIFDETSTEMIWVAKMTPIESN